MGEVSINYLAVLVCGAVSLVIGFLWYGPLFGKAWMKEVGKTEEELREGFNPGKTYTLAYISAFIAALALAYLLDLTGAQTIIQSLRISIAAWLGFVAALFYLNSLFEDKTVKHVAIHTGYYLVNLVVFGIILVSW
jgi:hypothetical protein